jgi:hypothetical protein
LHTVSRFRSYIENSCYILNSGFSLKLNDVKMLPFHARKIMFINIRFWWALRYTFEWRCIWSHQF